MGKNNPLRKTHPERKNYKLYKDKKQWVTACATFLIAMGATAVTSTAVHADTNTANDNEASAETKVTTQQENSNQINLLNDNQKSATDSTNTASAASTPTTTDNQQSSQSKNNSTDQQTSKQTTNATSADQSATSNSSAKAANKSVTTNENATDSASTKATPSTTTDQKQTLTVNKNQTVDSQTASTALLASAKSTSTTPSTVRDNYDVDRNWTYTDTDGSVALTAYKGTDLNVFIPNSADFNQAGHTDVKEVSISSSVIKDLINNAEQNNEVLKSIVVSSKDGKKVKASDSDWSEAFAAGYASPTNGAYLNNSDLNNMDISNVTKMANIFQNDSALTDYEGFANWNIHSIAYQFIDTDPIGTDTNVQINYNVIVSGKAGETVNTDLSVPTDFELVDSETLPTTITVPEKNQTVQIKIKPKSFATKINATLDTSDFATQQQLTYTGAPIKFALADTGMMNTEGLVVGADGNYYSLDNMPSNFDFSTDVTWLDNSYNPISYSDTAKTGTFYYYINDSGLKKLNAVNPQFNLSYDPSSDKQADQIGGVNVTQAYGTATLTGSASIVCTDSAVTPDDLNSKIKSSIAFTVTYPKNGNSNYQETIPLTAQDFVWYDASGHRLSQAPTSVGTYTIRTNRGIFTKTLRRLAGSGEDGVSANVIVSNSDAAAINALRATVTITAGAKATINGSQTYTPTENSTTHEANPITDADINVANYTGNWHTVTGNTTNDSTVNNLTLSQGDLTFVDAEGNPTTAPTHPGTYYVGLTSDALKKLSKAHSATFSNAKPVGTFIVKGVVKYVFQDSQNNDSQVGTPVDESATIGDGSQSVSLTIPDSDKYQLATGQTLPTSFSINSNSPLIQEVDIKLAHKIVTINPSDSTKLYGKDKTWLEQNGLVHDVTQTIHYVAGSILTDAQKAQLPADQTRTVAFYKTAQLDLATGKLVANSTSTDWQVNGTSSYSALTPKQITGATAKVNWVNNGGIQTYETQIPAFAPKESDADSKVTVTYDVVYRIAVYDDEKGSDGNPIGVIGYITPNYGHDGLGGWLKLLTNWPSGTQYTYLNDYVITQMPTLPSYLTIKGNNGVTLKVGASAESLDVPNYGITDKSVANLADLNGKTFIYHIGLADRDVTVHYVDADKNNSAVSDQTISGHQIGSTITLNGTGSVLTIPTNYVLDTDNGSDGKSINPSSYTLTDDTSQAITIYLKHKIGEDTDPADTQETRTVTTNYVVSSDDSMIFINGQDYRITNNQVTINGQTYTADASGNFTIDGTTYKGGDVVLNGHHYHNGDKLQDSAVLEVYYKRTATKDLVTGQVVSTGNWLWDTSRGVNGLHVVSGNWTLPTTWDANVEVAAPTITGFNAPDLNGDGTSSVKANLYVNPTFNGKNATNDDSNSVAYTDASGLVYEAKAVHNIYYVPQTYEGRVITQHYRYLDENAQPVAGDAGVAHADEQLEVFFKGTGSRNAKTNAITWTWQYDTSRGDASTPGAHIISGSWNVPGIANANISNNIPSVDGYTTVWYTANIDRSTSYKGQLVGTVGDVFLPGNTGDLYYYGPSTTTYYVPNDLLRKTVTRTINVTNPDGTVTPVVQTYTFQRSAVLNDQDTGIIFGVNANGDPYNNFEAGDNLWANTANLPVTVSDGTVTNGGNWDAYDTSKTGYTAIIKQVNADGTTTDLSSIPAVTDLTADSKDVTINVTYTATGSAVLSGNGSSTYNGSPISASDLNKNITVTVTAPTATNNNTYTLKQGDVEFSSDGGTTWTTTFPTNAGTYQVRLTSTGEGNIKSAFGNQSIVWTKDGASTITGTATYVINKATATVNFADNSGQTVNYTGNSQFDPTKYAVTISTNNGQALTIPTGVTLSVADGDFEFIPEGATTGSTTEPLNAGVYTVKLSDKGLQKIESNTDNYDWVNATSASYNIATTTETAKLSGNGSSTYNGKAISLSNLNGLSVAITGPTASLGNYTLKEGDVEFSKDGTTWTTTYPTDVNVDADGNVIAYQVRLTTQAINNIKAKYGNDSIIWTDTDGNSTITSDATYTINPLAIDSVLHGNDTKTYDGTDGVIDPSKYDFKTGRNVNGQLVDLNATGLTANDFEWTDDHGNALSSVPTTVGTYYIKLKDDSFTKLQKLNPNFTLTNTGLVKYVITPASATANLNGSGQRDYNGQTVSADDLNKSDANNTITLTLHYPAVENGTVVNDHTVQLSLDDITWNTADGKAPSDQGKYTFTLKSDAVKKLITDAVGTGQNGVSNVTFVDGAITGTATYTINKLTTNSVLANVTTGNYTKVFDGSATNTIDSTKFQLTTTVNGRRVNLNTTGINDGSYEWVDADGNPLTSNPKNVGTYYVKLTGAAFTTLQANNPNFTLTNIGLGVYTITQATGTTEISGTGSKTYDGVKVTLHDLTDIGTVMVTWSGANDQIGGTYALQDGDYTWNTSDGQAPTDYRVGGYTITLTKAGIKHIQAHIDSVEGTGTDASGNKVSNIVLSDTNTGSASYTINQSKNVIYTGGTQNSTYTSNPISITYNADGTNSVKVEIANADGNGGSVATLTNAILKTLTSDDFEVVDANGNAISATSAGTYKVVLKQSGLTKLQNALGNNFVLSINDANNNGSLVITKATGSVSFSGSHRTPFTNSAEQFASYQGDYTVSITAPGVRGYTLQDGDLEFQQTDGTWTTTAPTDHGTYNVRLSSAAWNRIKALNNSNISWPDSMPSNTGTGTYDVYAVSIYPSLSGKNFMTYNGHAATLTDINSNGSIKISFGDTGISGLHSITLPAGSYYWYDKNGNKIDAPKDVGNYTIRLNDDGITDIQNELDQQLGTGNVTVGNDDTGSAEFDILQAVAPNVQLYGNEQSTYNGSAVTFDPMNTDVLKNFGFNNVEGLTIPTFTSTDFEWVDADGNKIAAPTNQGTYYLQLNDNGKKKWADANPNYTFVNASGSSTITGRITYVVNPKSLTVVVDGKVSKVFDGDNAQITQNDINNGYIQVAWGDGESAPSEWGTISWTPDDFEVVDASGHTVSAANSKKGSSTGNPVYYVRLSQTGQKKLADLNAAHYSNYTLNYGNSTATYLIYQRKAQITLTGTQKTIYGTTSPLDVNNYHVDLSNWVGSGKPTITLTSGDLAIKGYSTNLPTNVGTYDVVVTTQLMNRLKSLYGANYDFDEVDPTVTGSKDYIHSSTGGSQGVDASHEPATYVIDAANATVTINGAQHIKYGQDHTLKYGDGGYTITITAPTVTGQSPLTYTLKDGDLQFVTTPGNVGEYTVKLTDQAINNLKALGVPTGSTVNNYNWDQLSDASATFYVDQMPTTISVAGTQTLTYGSAAWLAAVGKNPSTSDYTITVTTDPNGTGTGGSTITLPTGFTWNDGDLVFNQTLGNAGTYEVQLSDQGLQHLQTALGTNYSYPQDAAAVTSHGTMTVNQGTITVALTGSDSKTYDGQTTTALDPSKYEYTATIYKADGTVANVITLTADDLEFVDDDPTNVGTYNVKLSTAGENALKALDGNNGDNYTWTFDHTATYQIKQAAATAELSGANSRDYNGSAVSTNDLYAGNGTIKVSLAFPGATTNTYTLVDGDYDWYQQNADGTWTHMTGAPVNEGTYQLRLNATGIAHVKAQLESNAGAGQDNQSNVSVADDAISGTATFTINPQSVSDVTISGNDQSKTYDGSAASLDLSGLTINGTGTASGHGLVLPTGNNALTASDFDWYRETAKLDGAPTDAGTYQVVLKASALSKLQQANPNYHITSATGIINYTINPKPVDISVSGNGTRAYDGTATSASDILAKTGADKLTASANLLSGDQLTNNLTADSYGWFTKNADGTFTGLDGEPTNVGTYYLRLVNGTDQLNTDNPNYSFTIAQGDGYKYVITAADATATLSGANSKTYDGHAVTTAEVNSTSGNIIVTFNVPGNDHATYTLQDGDYTWNTADGSAPKNYKQGGYTITLSDQGLAHLQAALDNYAGAGNMTLANSGLTGSATFTINQKDATVSIDSKASGSKVYDEHPATMDKSDVVTGLQQTGFVNGDSLNTAGLTADKDFTWVDADGQPTSVPTNAGTYHIALTTDGLKQLQADNPNYKITLASGSEMTYTIKQAAAQVVIVGDQTFTPVHGTVADTDIDPNNYSGSYLDEYPGEETIPASDPSSIFVVLARGAGHQIQLHLQKGDLTFVDANGTPIAAPTHPGVYYVGLTDDAYKRITSENPNYSIKRGPLGTFRVKGIINYSFQDTNDCNKQVGTTTTVNALPSDGTQALSLTIPTNYELADGQTLPTSYTITTSDPLVQNVYIKLKHGTTTVDPQDPTTNPTTDPNWFKDQGLTTSVTRTINYTGLTAEQLGQIPADQTGTQTVNFTRKATYDKVTGQLVAGSAQPWTADGTSSFAGFTPKQFAGYTATVAGTSDNKVPEFTPTANDKDSTVTIAYTANNQQMTYKYVDDDNHGAQVGSLVKLNGKTDQTVKTGLAVPAGYQLASGQTLPTTYTFGTTNPEVMIHLVHQTKTIDENHIPNNSGLTKQDFQKDIKRTITAKEPSGNVDLSQTTTLTRTGTYDEVTKKVISWGAWSTSSFDAVNAPVVAGYTPSQSTVPAVATVTSDYVDPNIVIIYAANDQQMIYKFVDDDNHGAQVGSPVTISGKTDQTVKTGLAVPDGYALASGQTLPTTYTFGATNPEVTIHLVHQTKTIDGNHIPDDSGLTKQDFQKDVKRTITAKEPTGNVDLSQTTTLTRTGTYDEVTKKVISWGAWSTSSFDAVNAPVVAGYTPSQSTVPAVATVTSDYADPNIVITYAANDQRMTYKFVDDDNHGVQVGSPVTLKGKTNQTVNTGLSVPAGYQLASGQTLPTTYTFGTTNPEVTIHLVHQTKTIDGNHIPNGGQTPDGHDLTKQDFQKDVKRTITAKEPTGNVDLSQTTTLTRTGTYDEVTKKVTKWGDWSTSSFDAVNAPAVPGYTPSQSTVPAVATVTSDYVDPHIVITYAANEQTGKVSYVDVNDPSHEISHTDLSGRTGDDITITPQALAGWEIVPGQNIPTSVKATANGIPTVTIKVAQGKTIVTPETPKDQIPTGPVPGNPDKNYPAIEALKKSTTRTILVNKPDGTTQTIKQIVDWARNATFNHVTGDVTYSQWQVASSNSHWDAYDAPTIDGYTADPAHVAEVTPTADTADTTVTINYTAEKRSVVIKFVDQNGHVISTETKDGRVDQTIPLNLVVPAGYHLADGQSLPTSYRFTSASDQTILIHLVKDQPVQPVNPGDNGNHDHPNNGGNDHPNNGNHNNGNHNNNGGQNGNDSGSNHGTQGNNTNGGNATNGGTTNNDTTNSTANSGTTLKGVTAGNAAQTASHRKAQQLPQTGNTKNEAVALGFTFAGLATMLGLAGAKKKKEDR